MSSNSREIPADVSAMAKLVAHGVMVEVDSSRDVKQSVDRIIDRIARALMEQRPRWIPVEEAEPTEIDWYEVTLLSTWGDPRVEQILYNPRFGWMAESYRALGYRVAAWKEKTPPYLPPVPTTDE